MSLIAAGSRFVEEPCTRKRGGGGISDAPLDNWSHRGTGDWTHRGGAYVS